jgi:hypothetical protein
MSMKNTCDGEGSSMALLSLSDSHASLVSSGRVPFSYDEVLCCSYNNRRRPLCFVT